MAQKVKRRITKQPENYYVIHCSEVLIGPSSLLHCENFIENNICDYEEGLDYVIVKTYSKPNVIPRQVNFELEL